MKKSPQQPKATPKMQSLEFNGSRYVNRQTGKPIKNNEKKNLNGGNKKDDIEEEEKFEKLPQDQRDKHHVRLMRRLAVHMEHMKPDFWYVN